MPTLHTLPGDDVRQIMWRFAERYDLQMLVQSARTVARGPVARLVAAGERNSHEWTEAKNALLQAFDDAGITAAALDPEYGGFIPGPKNLALALMAFELSWVDGGAATCSLAGHLALAPIHERGTPEQQATYMSKASPQNGPPSRGAFVLTEPLPFVGVETGLLSGKLRVAEWQEGQEPILQVDKRGRFITNMAFADFATVAVDSDDPRIKGSCMVVLEKDDPGQFDRGTPARKLVHQLSSTRDPVFSLRVPASRIIGGYTVEGGTIVPRYSHSEIIASVFRRTRVTVGLMTAAKLLSAVEPVLRYARNRFRGGDLEPGSPRYDQGLQQKEDVLHRLIDVWSTGEAAASLGFATARLFDELDPLDRQKDALFAEQGLTGRKALVALKQASARATTFLKLSAQPEEERDQAQYEALESDPLVAFALKDALANVLCPACKLWNTGHGANVMREAVSLMGGYGITEDCPGFLGQKWMDAQLEATYEGPEAVQRRQLSVTMTQETFLEQFRLMIADLRQLAARKPGTGACALATAMQLWLWTLEHLQQAKDADGTRLFGSNRQGVSFALADALCWLLASHCQVMDVVELEARGPENPVVAEGLAGTLGFLTNLCHVQVARATGEVGRICAELVFGYNRHPACDDQVRGTCGGAEEPDATEDGLTAFVRLRTRLDGCLTGSRLAKDHAAEALARVMIPEAADYPA